MLLCVCAVKCLLVTSYAHLQGMALEFHETDLFVLCCSETFMVCDPSRSKVMQKAMQADAAKLHVLGLAYA